MRSTRRTVALLAVLSLLPLSLSSQTLGSAAGAAESPSQDKASSPGHRVLLQGNGRLVVLAKDGSTEWETSWGGIHDLHVLENGNFLLPRGSHEVVELDRATKEVVWSYDSGTQNGNEGRPVEVHAFQPLADGHVMIAESGPARIVEVDRDGKLVHSMPLTVLAPHPHMDTRLARRIEGGHYLVSHEGDGVVREYAPDGKVVFAFEVPLFGKERADGHGPEAYGNKTFCSLRAKDGHTWLSTGNGHGVLEVDRNGEILWRLAQNDLPGITLAWVTTLELLPNGHLVLGNCHAGPGQPLLVEVVPATKEVVWTLDRYDDFGNSVSNSLLLGEDNVR